MRFRGSPFYGAYVLDLVMGFRVPRIYGAY